MTNVSILVVGSGGREHALAWALARSPRVGQIYVAPGNAGTAEVAGNVPIGSEDIPALLTFAREKAIGLTVVGPEAPLAAGIVDAFQAAGLPIFGPGRAAAQVEASKAFAKAFMRRQGIPTAAYATFSDYAEARDYLGNQSLPNGVVVKASGLAAGKGVIICDDLAEAEAALQQIMVTREFGPAGDEVVIEERLSGPELSLLAFSDGRRVVPMLPARDHKRIYDGDQGPNTGGMGAYAPPPDVDQAVVDDIVATVLQPAITGLAEQGTPYVGVLYAGLMLTADGPKVLEFNCRFGDPETQAILPMLESDLAEIMLACLDGQLRPDLVRCRPGACATVVLAAPGYPGHYPKGLPISGVAEAAQLEHITVFHAGAAWDDGQLITSGGRVLAVSAWGEELPAAAARAYAAVAHIHFEGAHYRRDIAGSWR
ncbi:MAG: phosphoribosylamine--glycine ligase [Chloroflexi bacterium]|nr:phosphoribosylamine--glycine ligase [Chloroflexota bacterium]MCI0578148.1 phosphoribosylamine--glycine ligase [Chloroflexota bacterium]MCI0649858.1 phosphoribosylamine--glycine ligase [Chloroflexota bacterium]MCI0730280.1 phosphoribosylamine--glycine ligase [Chloroflexota bacterium]